MKIFFQRITLYLFLALLERSFLSVLFPNLPIPLLMVALVMSIVIILSFEKGWPWVILAALVYELSGTAEPGLFLPFSVVFAYGASFLSKRFILEHRLLGLMLLGVAAGLMSFVFPITTFFFEGMVPSFPSLFMIICVSAAVFPPVFLLLSAWEKRLAFGQMAEFRGVQS